MAQPHDISFLRWQEESARQEDALAQWMCGVAQPGHKAHGLLAQLFQNSPYLTRLALLNPNLVKEFFESETKPLLAGLMNEMTQQGPALDTPGLMRCLRMGKNKIALLLALADLSGKWDVPQVTQALSDFAELALTLVVSHLLARAHRLGEIALADAHRPMENSGLVVLGMGKLGGWELNYSSDIDLIILFEKDRLAYKGRHTEQHFMNKLAHELVQMMQERTQDGYVFRTDLRLRPDPASTPPAVNMEAAYNYYESVGQNWERAAMIKARCVAGDLQAGERFLKHIRPFMWRRSLDFASIQDIHSIKRQMDTRQSKAIRINGHNIKLGLGGIREIEFYVQIHQLIWGGREPDLRTRPTLETLGRLVKYGHVEQEKAALLTQAYLYLRKLEHRLQMVEDEQTHTLPQNDPDIARIARLMGYDSIAPFEQELLVHLNAVHAIFASSFRSSEKLGEEGNLVFTGVSHDPDTLETLRRMGYSNAETVSEIVMGWHHGSRRATRTKRARELLTELMPMLLKRLAETANPDSAFLKFHEFLCNLPSGVQIFSLFSVNPQLLGLIADIMGSAPMLAERLSKAPHLLDAVLYSDFYQPLPGKAQLEHALNERLQGTPDFEARMNLLRIFRNEKQFQAGVHLLKGMTMAAETGQFLSDLADAVLAEAWRATCHEFERTHGTLPNSRFAVIGLGKLGSREMTFGSDIDLVFVYDAADSEALSSGQKSYAASVYYNRLAQRFVNGLTAMEREGRLYEVDTRLRPSGSQGLLAVSKEGFVQYFNESAWTFEFMAFCKGRALTGDGSLCDEMGALIANLITRPRDLQKLRADVNDMRQRIDKEFGATNPWDIKYVRGGLMEIDFLAQFMLLAHGSAVAGAKPGSAREVFGWIRSSGIYDPRIIDELLESERMLSQLFHMIRLSSDRNFNEATALPGLKKLLCDSLHMPDFETLKTNLIEVEARVLGHYISVLNLKQEITQ